jgi:hypothetical protein
MFTKKPTICAGAMSGTSMDGVDGAQIMTDGENILEFGPTLYNAYSEQEKSVLLGALGKWADDDGLEEAYDIIHLRHIEVLSQFPQAELFGFHGQTLAHDPKGQRTHQLGDGKVLANALGRPVAWDFRSADVGLGGEVPNGSRQMRPLQFLIWAVSATLHGLIRARTNQNIKVLSWRLTPVLRMRRSMIFCECALDWIWTKTGQSRPTGGFLTERSKYFCAIRIFANCLQNPLIATHFL